MQLEPYLFFNGDCEEAMNFYAKVFDGKVDGLTRFSEAPPGVGHDGDASASSANRVMHVTFESASVRFMASDGREGKEYKDGNVSLALATSDLAEGERIFKALSEGAEVEMQLADQFWGARFGMLTDRFGISWMMNISLRPAHA